MNTKKDTTTTHTPGPWAQDGRPGETELGYPCQDVWAKVNGNPVHVADVVGTLPGDANLIAAAPELLAALEAALVDEHHDHCCDYALSFSRARMADGRTLRGKHTYDALVAKCRAEAEPCNCWVSQARAAIAKANGGA